VAAADVALALGRVDQAVTQLRMACMMTESVHGPTHPESMALRAELAKALAEQSAAQSDQPAPVTSRQGPSATREEPGRHPRQGTDR
jgi:hypothetical protein